MNTRYTLLLLLFLKFNTYAQAPVYSGALKEVFKGPASAADRENWLIGLKAWRDNEQKRLNYNGALYTNPRLQWVKHTFIYVQMMAHDRYFYDPITRKYTVSRYLNDLKKRYGGIDAVLIWPTYPNIGIDNRNQFDLTADLPGGKTAVRQMIQDFKAKGVRVFFPIMIWDRGTQRIALTMPKALINEMKALGADGLNGDTMAGVSEDFYTAAKTENYSMAFQPELNLHDLKMAEWNTLSWGYYWGYEYAPGVSIYKWFEPRHQVNITNRWAINKTDDLQYSFFNGIGYNSWENIWTVWNQIADRYAETIRRISTIYHQFPDVWSSNDWEPYISVLQKGVFASRFPGKNRTVYTFINRDSTDVNGEQISLPYHQNEKYYDLWSGQQLKPEIKNGNAVLSFGIEGHGYGAVMIVNNAVKPSELSFLKTMAVLSKRKLKSFSTAWNPIPQQMVPIASTKTPLKDTEGMIKIPGTDSYQFESVGVMIEGNELPTAVGVQHPWETHPSRSQKHMLSIKSFYIDKYPVTNKQFKAFLTASKYHPADDHNFLKDWVNGNYADGTADQPVTWVSIEDTRAYAKWAGKRLPHEWEWQYAAQGTDGRLYPWGNDKNQGNYPVPDTTRAMRKPTKVNEYPAGASTFGVMDMAGNVWQWTDEYTDAHSRTAILKGSSYFHAQTSGWYFPPALEVNKYGKYLLMSPGMDRAATLGFRCVADSK
ncbi:formylglycine-generating enzyme family protein [Mucilaginibacter sp. UYCu711]|uniref:formylglycine-generating enzyme family protein n=1 Tax=Mucilaginibacter sp. UYCu711 TaxID=3156339 RepID=UPI003D25A065